MKHRSGRSSARWGFMRRMVLRRTDGLAYLDRLRLIQCPWFGVYLHRMDSTDPGVDLHDHPWPFVSIILRGGYDEWRAETRAASSMADFAETWPSDCTPGAVNHRGWLSVQRMRADECHTIFNLHRTPTWTLIVVGRRFRDWGFYVPRSSYPTGYVGHVFYETLNRRQLTYQDDL